MPLARSQPHRRAAHAWWWGVACTIFAGASSPACTGSVGNCTGPTYFEAFQPSASTSAIPVCTDVVDAAVGGASSVGFGGASALSAKGVAQCQAICAGSVQSGSCCLSQWEPETVVCTPACQ